MVLLTVLPATRLLFVLLSFEVTVASGMGDASKDLMVEAPLLRYEDLSSQPPTHTHTRTISCWTLLAVFVVLSKASPAHSAQVFRDGRLLKAGMIELHIQSWRYCNCVLAIEDGTSLQAHHSKCLCVYTYV